MFFRERRRDRRRSYSIRGHVARLRSEGRLRIVATRLAVFILIAGVSLSRCRGADITGPPATPPSSPAGTPTDLTGVEPVDKLAIAVYPASLLPPVNPCNAEAILDQSGDAHFTYHTVEDSDGKAHTTYHDEFHRNGKSPSGDTYQSMKISDNLTTVTGDPYPVVFNHEYDVTVASNGPAPRFKEHVVVHFVINKNTLPAGGNDYVMTALIQGVTPSCF